ncbi:MAG: hypothetical protein HY754_10690 [Nitrospirae bacterium]|nr:hypothetical protein [Nitrospirota bacterium]
MFSAKDKELRKVWTAGFGRGLSVSYIVAPEKGVAKWTTREPIGFVESLAAGPLGHIDVGYVADFNIFATTLISTYDQIAELFALKFKQDRSNMKAKLE